MLGEWSAASKSSVYLVRGNYYIFNLKKLTYSLQYKVILLSTNEVRPLLRVTSFQFNWFKNYIPVFPHEPWLRCSFTWQSSRENEREHMRGVDSESCLLPFTCKCCLCYPFRHTRTWTLSIYLQYVKKFWHVHIFGEIPLLLEWVSFSVQQGQDFI